jgi:hypothetical protein
MEIKKLRNTIVEATLALKKKGAFKRDFDGLSRPSSDSQSHPNTLTCYQTNWQEILADTFSYQRNTCL